LKKKGGEYIHVSAAGLQPSLKLKLKKKTDFVDIMIWNFLRALHLSRNQKLKSADD
jgi:hypothetical protein